MAQKIVIANFKMNKVDEEVSNYLSTLIPATANTKAQIVLAVPSVSIKTASTKCDGTSIMIAGQNVNSNAFGAFTGEVNSEMLKSVGAKAVLVGHSERRIKFDETDEQINKKIMSALRNGLICIFCIGETLFERKNNLTAEVISKQLRSGLKSIYANELKNIVIAYEPVWSIGTGVLPQKEQIADAIKQIKTELAQMYDEQIAKDVSVVYGGSVTETNCKEISKISQLGGVLVGGTSLVPEKFAKIVACFESKR